MRAPRMAMGTEHELCYRGRNGAESMTLLHNFPASIPNLKNAHDESHSYWTGYGLFYPDCRGVEVATCECLTPFDLAQINDCCEQIIWQMQQSQAGLNPVTNKIHNELLHAAVRRGDDDTVSRSAHESYLCEYPPHYYTDMIAFLATRYYAGAGAVGRDGNYYLNSRMAFTVSSLNGHTRSILCLRDEPHTINGHRLHITCGDGQRSQYSQVLKAGATALTILAIQHFGMKAREYTAYLEDPLGFAHWCNNLDGRATLTIDDTPAMLPFLQRKPVLGGYSRLRGTYTAVHAIQECYWIMARDYLNTITQTKENKWLWDVLKMWRESNFYYAHWYTRDHDYLESYNWLAQRHDAWIKHKLITNYLQSKGASWPIPEHLRQEACLIDHKYHEWSEDSLFYKLDIPEARLVERIVPGSEQTPYVPDIGGRAELRARVIAAGSREIVRVYWSEMAVRIPGTMGQTATHKLQDVMEGENPALEQFIKDQKQRRTSTNAASIVAAGV